MTLTDFLLARIAEDEEPTFEVLPYDCEPGCCAPAGWVGHRCLICGGATSYGGTVEAITEIAEEHAEQVHQRPRVLAESAVKRRILSYAGLISEDPTLPSHHLARHVLSDMATVYGDHPDYREEWR